MASKVWTSLTKEIVSERGRVREQTIENFLAAGYGKDQLLEILIGVPLKTMSNYLDHILPNGPDHAFRSEGYVLANDRSTK